MRVPPSHSKPGASQDVPILFRALPQKDGDGTDRDVTAKLAIKVIDNRYEASSIELRGATFETDLSIEDLPDGEEDDLKFGNLALGDGPTSLRAEFTLRNVRNNTVALCVAGPRQCDICASNRPHPGGRR